MAVASPLSTNLFYGRKTNQEQAKAQQQYALAQALLQQGITPIDTNNRMVGNIAYKISPWEGINKIAQALTGAYGENQASNKYYDALIPPDQREGATPAQSQGQNGSAGDATPQLPAPMNVNGQLPPTNGIAQALSQVGQSPQDPNSDYGISPMAQAMMGGDKSAIAQYGMMMLQNPDTSRAGAEILSKFAGPTQEQLNASDPRFGNAVVREQNLKGAPYLAKAAEAAANQQAAAQTPSQTLQQINQAAGGSPMGAAQIPTENMPQVPMSDLNAPAGPSGSMPAAPATPLPVGLQQPTDGSIGLQGSASQTATPDPSGMTGMQYQNTLKQGQAEAESGGSDTGKNLADATKTYNVATSNFPRAVQRFNELKSAAKDASSGAGVDEEEPGSISDFARNMARTGIGNWLEPKTTVANQIIDQATKQGVLAELGPQLAGLRGNKFLEGIASGASGLNPADPADAKISAVNGLQDQYISNMNSLLQQRRMYGDATAPSDLEFSKTISKNMDPNTQINVIDPVGKFGKVNAAHLSDLIRAGGKIR